MQEQRKSTDVRPTPRPYGILISLVLTGNLPEKASSHPGEFTKNWLAGFTVYVVRVPSSPSFLSLLSVSSSLFTTGSREGARTD